MSSFSLPMNVRDFMLNKGKTIVCRRSTTGSPVHTLTNASVYPVRVSEINNPTSGYIKGDRRIVFAKTDADAVGYIPKVDDLITYNNSEYCVLDENPGESFDQYKLTARRV